MLKSLLSSTQSSVLERALAASELRHKVISNNIANVNTPGFKKSEVLFEDKLREALNGTPKAALARTNEKHLPTPVRQQDATPSVLEITDTTFRVDKSNVDIDSEVAALAKNNIYYNAVAQQITKYYSNLRSAIFEGRR